MSETDKPTEAEAQAIIDDQRKANEVLLAVITALAPLAPEARRRILGAMLVFYALHQNGGTDAK